MSNIDNSSLFKISYGLYVITTKGDKDNAMVANTAIQLTSNPLRLSVTINKSNYSHDIITSTESMTLRLKYALIYLSSTTRPLLLLFSEVAVANLSTSLPLCIPYCSNKLYGAEVSSTHTFIVRVDIMIS